MQVVIFHLQKPLLPQAGVAFIVEVNGRKILAPNRQKIAALDLPDLMKGALFTTQLEIEKSIATPLLTSLALNKSLYYEGKLLQNALLIPLELYLIFEEGKALRGGFKSRSLDIPFEKIELFLPASRPFCVVQGKIYRIEKTLFSAVDAMAKGKILSEKEKEGMIAKLDQEQIEWIDLSPSKKEIPLPEIHLKDPFGKAICFLMQGEDRSFWHDCIAENSGYRPKKTEQATHYHASPDVGTSLLALQKQGYLLFAMNGKRLVIEKASFEEALEESSHILLTGLVASDGLNLQQAKNLLENGYLFSQEKLTISPLANTIDWGEIGYCQKGLLVAKYRISLLEKVVCRKMAANVAFLIKELSDESKLPPLKSFKGTLLPFQQKAVSQLYRLYSLGLGALLADQMGLGKTVQVLAFLSLLGKKRVLIALPSTLIFQWQHEMEKFVPDLEVVVLSSKNEQELEKEAIFLVSHSILRLHIDRIQAHHFSVFCIDEAHVIRNPKSKIHAACKKIKADFRLSLTGTPLFNSEEDLFAQFSFLLPGWVTSVSEWAALLKKGSLQLQKELSSFWIRRTKEEVSLDMPDRFEQTAHVCLGEAELAYYMEWCGKTFTEEQEEKTPIQILEKILRLRQIVIDPRLFDEEKRFIRDLPWGKSPQIVADLCQLAQEGHRVVLFSQFREYLHLLAGDLSKEGVEPLILDGQTKNREEILATFKTSRARPLLVTLQVGGVGLNLNEADWVLLADPWWNEALEEQAIFRAYRMGRERALWVKRYIAHDTIEEKVERLKSTKKEVSDLWLELSQNNRPFSKEV